MCKVQVPNFHKLSAISLLAAVMSISYSTIAIGVSAHAGRQPGAEYNLNGFTKAEGVFGIFNALGTIAFAYGGHNVVLEIQVGRPFPALCWLFLLLAAFCFMLAAVCGLLPSAQCTRACWALCLVTHSFLQQVARCQQMLQLCVCV